MFTDNARFDFSLYEGTGASGFGLAHGKGIDLRPTLPETTPDLVGRDYSHTIYVSDFAPPAGQIDFSSARASKPGGGKGGGGGGDGTLTTFTSTVAGSTYNITIEFKGVWTTAFQNVFIEAANRLSAIIIGDVPDARVIQGGRILTVDDILITAELKTIDGAGGVLGQAGPTSYRVGSYFPATATMQFDVADAQRYLDAGGFDEIVTHEMIHSLGFGTLWKAAGLVQADGALLNFIGALATAEYRLLSGDASAPGVPVETDGGSGTAGGHWDEETFDTELMTGYLGSSATSPLSRMTALSLADFGYVVNANSSAIDQGYILV